MPDQRPVAFREATAHLPDPSRPTGDVPPSVLTVTQSGDALPTGPLELPPSGVTTSPRWTSWYVAALLALDMLALLLGGLFGHLIRFASFAGTLDGVGFPAVLAVTAPVWLLFIAAARGYERRFLGLGGEEFRRVANAAVRFTALVAVTVFLFKWDVARGLVVLALPSATLLTLLFRGLARGVLHRLRRHGRACHRVLVVGDGPSRDTLTRRLADATHSGLRVVGVCRAVTQAADGSPSVQHVLTMVEALHADTVAVAHSSPVTPDVLRGLAWSLEGTGVSLLVAPALTDVAGPRVNIRPVSGLPLLQIAEPEFTGARRVVKNAFDVVLAGVGLLVAAPLFIAIAVLVRLSGPGPVLFRQTRIGRNGEPFRMLKFRSMYVDAEERLAELRPRNDHGDGVLFKMRDDPRITPVGLFLRRYSLDELPQLINVLRGQMSMVGPRPPLPAEVARYERHVRRRFLVKPGLTGLWQVSGRADLDWNETVRLDLYYVENWSVALDAEILAKTLSAVLRGAGAR